MREGENEIKKESDSERNGVEERQKGREGREKNRDRYKNREKNRGGEIGRKNREIHRDIQRQNVGQSERTTEEQTEKEVGNAPGWQPQPGTQGPDASEGAMVDRPSCILPLETAHQNGHWNRWRNGHWSRCCGEGIGGEGQ